MPCRLLPCLLCVLAAPAFGAGMTVDIQIPRLDVAEYHRPYVAAWIEREDNSVAANLAVWYQHERAQKRPQNRERGAPRSAAQAAAGAPAGDGPSGAETGSTWLPDLRQWWRRSGRSLQLPVDGVTGATRPVGTHTLDFDASDAPLASLTPGNYRLVVEAAREVGGREVLKLPFAWPPAAARQADAEGTRELGRIVLRLSP